MPMDLELPLDLLPLDQQEPAESNNDEAKKPRVTRERFFDNDGSLPSPLL